MAFATASPLSRAEHPEEHNVYTFGPFTEAAAAVGGHVLADGTTVHLMLFDRDCDIESISLRASAAGSAHYIQFLVAASGVAAGSATAISPATDDADSLTADTVKEVQLNQTGSPHLNITAGSILLMSFEGSLVTLANLLVTVRTRNRTYRTTTAGGKQWNHGPEA